MTEAPAYVYYAASFALDPDERYDLIAVALLRLACEGIRFLVKSIAVRVIESVAIRQQMHFRYNVHVGTLVRVALCLGPRGYESFACRERAGFYRVVAARVLVLAHENVGDTGHLGAHAERARVGGDWRCASDFPDGHYFQSVIVTEFSANVGNSTALGNTGHGMEHVAVALIGLVQKNGVVG